MRYRRCRVVWMRYRRLTSTCTVLILPAGVSRYLDTNRLWVCSCNVKQGSRRWIVWLKAMHSMDCMIKGVVKGVMSWNVSSAIAITSYSPVAGRSVYQCLCLSLRERVCVRECGRSRNVCICLRMCRCCLYYVCVGGGGLLCVKLLVYCRWASKDGRCADCTRWCRWNKMV